MDVIDAKWIKERLTGKRGEQSRLAEAMGIDNDKMSKTLRGERRVQPEEIPKVLEFFKERIVSADDPNVDLEDLLLRFGRLNRAGRAMMRKQLDLALDTPEFVQSSQTPPKDD